MKDVYLLGTSCTPFGKLVETSFQELTKTAYMEAVQDAGLEDGNEIEMVWFSNCGMGSWGQSNIRGQVAFIPTVQEGLFPERIPVINVEGGCASASLALHGAWKDILSGESDLSLAVGVEKMVFPNRPEFAFNMLSGAIDQLDSNRWKDYYAKAGELVGKPFEVTEGKSIFMETYAMQAAYHAKRFGSTPYQLACAASKTHKYGALNSKAQYRFTMTPEEILADRIVSSPLTRAMCAPIGDGAAAALLCSEEFLKRQPGNVQRRAIRIAASALSGGKYRSFDEPSLTKFAADKAYAMANCRPTEIQIAEVHDATSFAEIYQAEMLGFCDLGEGGVLAETGETAIGGRIPINLSGGLISKGHPIGATGLSMVYEMVQQLRGEADERQVPGAKRGLIENGGGVIGFDEAVCSVVILEAN